jgi:hypothetical protein
MREIFRRVGLLLGIPAALLLYAWPANDLISLRAVDWSSSDDVSHSRRSAYRTALRMLADSPGGAGPEAVAAKEFIAQAIAAETAGRLWRTESASWTAVARALEEGRRGDNSAAAWEARRGMNGSHDDLYFRMWEPPAVELPADWLGQKGLVYVLVEAASPQRYVMVMPVSPTGVAYSAPRHLAYPYRNSAFWLGLVILAPYVLTPWPRGPGIGIVYATRGQTFAADLVGTILYASFIGMWAMLMFSPSGPAGDVSGAIIITLILWAFGLTGVLLYGVAIWYACKRLELVDDDLVYSTWHGVVRHQVRDLIGIDSYVKPQPVFKWFKIIGAMVSLLNWRALSPTLILTTEEDRLRFRFANGEEIGFGALPLEAAGPLIGALRARGVCVDRSVYERYGCKPTDAAFTGPAPVTGTLVWMYVVVGLVATGLVYGALQTLHPALPRIAAGSDARVSSGVRTLSTAS